VIAFLDFASSEQMGGRLAAFERGLDKFGYLGGKNVVIEHRSANGQSNLLAELAAELVRRRGRLAIDLAPVIVASDSNSIELTWR
jgi:ABC-type uncharacterized transport system substrate-binding protein